MIGIEGWTVLVVIALVIIGVVSYFSQRLGVAAPLVLVLVGAGLSAIPSTPHLEVSPEIILTVVLPPLLYAAALKMPFVDFRRNLKVIISLAVVLVVISAVAAGLVVHWAFAGVGLALALALGAVVAPPDAVAAISLGKRLGLPPRVMTILEGEGLVNDATALVMLSTALAVATHSSKEPITGWTVAADFVWAVIGAVVIGTGIGFLVVKVRAKLSDPVLDLAISLCVPFVVFLVAEEIHASGIVAVVFAGIWVGNRGKLRIPAARRRTEENNWSSFTLLVEDGVFLVMGYLLPPVVETVASEMALLHAITVGIVVAVVLIVVRFAYLPIVLYSMRHSARRKARRHEAMTQRFHSIDPEVLAGNERFLRRVDRGRARLERQKFDVTAEHDQALGWRDHIILGMAGMRGVVTIAAVQTLPATSPHYHSLVLIAFVAAIATLLPQGFLLPFAVRRLKPPRESETQERSEDSELMRRLLDSATEAIETELSSGSIDPDVSKNFQARLQARSHRNTVMQHDAAAGRRHVDQMRQLFAIQLAAERKTLAAERRRGEFSSESLAKAQRVLDDHEIQLEQFSGNE